MISKTFAEAFARMAPYKGALPYSYSRAQTLRRCPLQFEYQYRNRGVPRGTPFGNDDTRTGWLAHKILECTVKTANARGILSTVGGDFEATFDKWVSTADNDFQKSDLLGIKRWIEKVAETVLSIVADGYVPIVERSLKFSKSGEHIKTMGVPFEDRRRFSDNLGFSGFVDLELKRDGELLIYDYKTEFPSPERAESVERQMALYAFCELEVRPSINCVVTNVAYLRNARIDQVGVYSRGKPMDELRDRVVGWLDEYVRALENFSPDRKRNDYCKYCSFAELCGGGQME